MSTYLLKVFVDFQKILFVFVSVPFAFSILQSIWLMRYVFDPFINYGPRSLPAPVSVGIS